MRRLAERTVALLALVAVAPVLFLGAAGVQFSSRGPVLYRARRVGRGGREFAMLKLRTMRVDGGGGRITGAHDARVVSRFGVWLRRLKIDELPQLWNIVRGEMAIIGPRPEDPEIVRRCYAPEHRALLEVLPGLASPGSLYCATHADRELPDLDAEGDYIKHVLPITTALDLFYVRHASWWYDLRLVGRTLRVIAAAACGRRSFPEPPERQEALS